MCVTERFCCSWQIRHSQLGCFVLEKSRAGANDVVVGPDETAPGGVDLPWLWANPTVEPCNTSANNRVARMRAGSCGCRKKADRSLVTILSVMLESHVV